MCLVSSLPKGTTKYSDEVTSFIKAGMSSNRDGSGFMYKRDGESQITVSKGHFSLQALQDALKEANLKDSDELVIHHRIGTAGLVTPENTHPFVVSHIHEEVKAVNITTSKPCVVHNGMFRYLDNYERKNPDFSDTYAFTRYILANTIDLYKNELSVFKEVFKSVLGWSRVCILFPDRNMIMSGDFTEDNGYFHSNGGYKDWNHRDVGGVTHSNLPATQTWGKHGVGTTGGDSNSVKKQLQLAVLASITKNQGTKNKTPVVLDGNSIDINNWNCKHFVYQKKDSSNTYAYTLDDCESENIILEMDRGNHIQMTHSTMAKLHSDYNFHPKAEYKNYYEEYSILLTRVTPSKNQFKQLYRVLSTNRNKNLANTFKIKGINATRFTLINFYMSLVKGYMSQDSQFYNTKIEELVDVYVRDSIKVEDVDAVVVRPELENASCEC